MRIVAGGLAALCLLTAAPAREPEQVKAFRITWRDGIHSYLTYLRDIKSIRLCQYCARPSDLRRRIEAWCVFHLVLRDVVGSFDDQIDSLPTPAHESGHGFLQGPGTRDLFRQNHGATRTARPRGGGCVA
jgi:hypothetical protein